MEPLAPSVMRIQMNDTIEVEIDGQQVSTEVQIQFEAEPGSDLKPSLPQWASGWLALETALRQRPPLPFRLSPRLPL